MENVKQAHKNFP